MYILLSSAYRPRYREDILRCLSAPIGATVQFRYDMLWVESDIWDNPNRLANEEGLVCFVDNTPMGRLPVVPVRFVQLVETRRHGTTLSTRFKMKEFPCLLGREDSDSLISSPAWNGPKKLQEGQITGCYFFESNTDTPPFVKSLELANWEQIVTHLSSLAPFSQEWYFLTILGVYERKSVPASPMKFEPLPNQLVSRQPYSLAVYHYINREPSDTYVQHLVVKHGGTIEPLSEPRIRIDSRYDLKLWHFESRGELAESRQGWIEVQSAPEAWGIELVFETPSMIKRAMLLVLILAAALWISNSIDSELLKGWGVVLSLLGALVAAIVIVFGIRKP